MAFDYEIPTPPEELTPARRSETLRELAGRVLKSVGYFLGTSYNASVQVQELTDEAKNKSK